MKLLQKECLKVIKDSTTPKLEGANYEWLLCLKVIKDSTTPKLKSIDVTVW